MPLGRSACGCQPGKESCQTRRGGLHQLIAPSTSHHLYSLAFCELSVSLYLSYDGGEAHEVDSSSSELFRRGDTPPYKACSGQKPGISEGSDSVPRLLLVRDPWLQGRRRQWPRFPQASASFEMRRERSSGSSKTSAN